MCTPIYGVISTDRVYQGMTISFDFSIEEIWPTFVAARRWCRADRPPPAGPGLADFLIDHHITMLYCVPTLLATLDRDVPALRVVNVGGEACPHELVRRWARPDRRMLNTYGPTETTVTATWAELTPDRPVTIGQPLPTYRVYLLDESLRPVPDGEPGEICVGGPGVAQGYVNRPELTAERFPLDPFAHGNGDQRLYRTGDLGRLTLHDEIEFLGRIDSQVKIRGYRIELTEIEAILQQSTDVEGAVVHVHDGDMGMPELAAYVTRRAPEQDVEELRERLFARVSGQVPPYMVPAYIEVVASIPVLPSGKADRARLPAPASRRLGTLPGAVVPPNTPMEAELAAAWAGVFGVNAISVEADFFRDLGGDSLRAALIVSQLRQRETLRNLSIGDLYTHSTVRTLARHRETHGASPTRTRETRTPLLHGTLRVLGCGAAQLVLLYLLLATFATPYALQLPTMAGGLSLPLLMAALAIFPLTLLLRLLAPIALKWLLIGRFRPGRYPLWGWYYCRWWLVRKALGLAPLGYLSGSPLISLYLRMLGARVGKECFIGTPRLDMPDLLDIGDGASIGYAAVLEALRGCRWRAGPRLRADRRGRVCG